jgi:hypothetical protein
VHESLLASFRAQWANDRPTVLIRYSAIAHHAPLVSGRYSRPTPASVHFRGQTAVRIPGRGTCWLRRRTLPTLPTRARPSSRLPPCIGSFDRRLSWPGSPWRQPANPRRAHASTPPGGSRSPTRRRQ